MIDVMIIAGSIVLYMRECRCTNNYHADSTIFKGYSKNNRGHYTAKERSQIVSITSLESLYCLDTHAYKFITVHNHTLSSSYYKINKKLVLHNYYNYYYILLLTRTRVDTIRRGYNSRYNNLIKIIYFLFCMYREYKFFPLICYLFLL